MDFLFDGLATSSTLQDSFECILTVLRKSADIEHMHEVLGRLIEVGFSTLQGNDAGIFDVLLGKGMARFDDLKFYSYRKLAKLLHGCNEDIKVRVFDITVEAGSPSDLSGSTLIDGPFEKSVSSWKGEYGSIWMGMNEIPSKRIKKFISLLEKTIFPNVFQYELFLPILLKCYENGGLIGILSLDAIFILMKKKNLDFPQFYDKLYSLLDNKILHAPWRNIFLMKLNLFMTSDMLPAYIVAAMVKKIISLCVVAPPGAIIWSISFAYNLLKQYPVCRVLIHREIDDLEWSDPFIFNCSDISKTNALESSLWELEILEKHYWTKISKLPKIFREKFTKPLFDLDAISLECDEINILNSDDVICKSSSLHSAIEELNHKWSKRPPARNNIPTSAF